MDFVFLSTGMSSTSLSFLVFDRDNQLGTLYPLGGLAMWFLNGTYQGQSAINPGDSASAPFTFSGLSPGTLYTISIKGSMYGDDGSMVYEFTHETTQATPGRPPLFAWTVPKIAGEQFYVGADEWKALHLNIYYTVVAAGYAYGIMQQYPSPGDIITAERYNELRAAIRNVPGYGLNVPEVYAGQVVTAAHLNLLVSAVNAIP